MRPFPKLEIFGKNQQSVANHPRQKELSNKQHFSHIVSPVGAYMKKTASTPLMSTGKMKSTNANVLNSSAFRELEYESRLCQAKIGTNTSLANSTNGGLSPLPGSLNSKSTLPKKAYISSQLKHVSGVTFLFICIVEFLLVMKLHNFLLDVHQALTF